jgi:hypothetical protein
VQAATSARDPEIRGSRATTGGHFPKTDVAVATVWVASAADGATQVSLVEVERPPTQHPQGAVAVKSLTPVVADVGVWHVGAARPLQYVAAQG